MVAYLSYLPCLLPYISERQLVAGSNWMLLNRKLLVLKWRYGTHQQTDAANPSLSMLSPQHRCTFNLQFCGSKIIGVRHRMRFALVKGGFLWCCHIWHYHLLHFWARQRGKVQPRGPTKLCPPDSPFHSHDSDRTFRYLRERISTALGWPVSA